MNALSSKSLNSSAQRNILHKSSPEKKQQQRNSHHLNPSDDYVEKANQNEITQDTSSGVRNSYTDMYPPPSYGMGTMLGGYSPSYSPGIGMMPMMGGGGLGLGALSNINQFLFSVQTIIFSLGQAVQIIGMNTQALHQLYDQAVLMLDHGLQFLHELKSLELKASRDIRSLSPEEVKRRRRLKALRWGIVLSLTYAGYAIVHKWMKRRSGHLKRRKGLTNGIGNGTTFSYPPPNGSGSWMHHPQPSYSFPPQSSPYSPPGVSYTSPSYYGGPMYPPNHNQQGSYY